MAQAPEVDGNRWNPGAPLTTPVSARTLFLDSVAKRRLNPTAVALILSFCIRSTSSKRCGPNESQKALDARDGFCPLTAQSLLHQREPRGGVRAWGCRLLTRLTTPQLTSRYKATRNNHKSRNVSSNNDCVWTYAWFCVHNTCSEGPRAALL